MLDFNTAVGVLMYPLLPYTVVMTLETMNYKSLEKHMVKH